MTLYGEGFAVNETLHIAMVEMWGTEATEALLARCWAVLQVERRPGPVELWRATFVLAWVVRALRRPAGLGAWVRRRSG